MEEKIKNLEERVKYLEKELERYVLIDKELNYMPIREYYYDKGSILTPDECKKLGTAMTVYCNKRKIPVYKGKYTGAYSENTVNTYPINVLNKFYRDFDEDDI